MKIVLIGYMGSGKSTVGKLLAKTLSLNHVDLDTYIQEKDRQSIDGIFKNKGEIYFRKIERTYLHEVLQLERTVISLGGGTPCYGDNMQFIQSKNDTQSIHLKASIANLVSRLNEEKSRRPLIKHLQSEEELTEFIGKHLFERNLYYSQSDFTVSVDKKSTQEIVEEIITKLF